MSAASASSRPAARRRAASRTSLAAAQTALPPICSDRDAAVPPPRGTSAVSLWTTRTWSAGTPSTSPTSWEKAVACPWPCEAVPARTVTVPSSSTATEPNSRAMPAAVTLHIGGHADAEQPPVPRSPPAGLLIPEFGVAGGVEGQVQGAGRSRRSPSGPRWGVVRGNSSGASRLRRRSSAGSMPSSAAARSTIRSRLSVASGRPAPRKGRHRGGVGDRGHRLVVNRGYPVGPRRHQHGEDGQHRADPGVGAGVGGGPDPEPAEGAVCADAELDVMDVVPSLGHVDQVLAAGLHPLDRAAQISGQPRGHQELRVDAGLGAESAADGRGDDPHLLGRRLQRGRHRVADVVGALGRAPQRHAVGAVSGAGRGQHGRGLDRGRRDAVVDDAALHHQVVAGHRLGIGGRGELHRQVRSECLHHHRGAGFQSLERVGHRGERLVAHVHQLGRVDRGAARLGRHRGDRVAHVAGHVGQRKAAGLRRQHDELRLGADRQVRGGQDFDHPRRGPGGTGVDGCDAGVGHRRSHEGQMQGSRRRHVVHKAGLPGEQVGVLPAEHRVAHERS